MVNLVRFVKNSLHLRDMLSTPTYKFQTDKKASSLVDPKDVTIMGPAESVEEKNATADSTVHIFQQSTVNPSAHTQSPARFF